MLKNFWDIISEGLAMDGTGKLILWIVLALAFSALCWYICTNYTKLWNKRYHVTGGFHVLCGIAALVTFFAVLAFIGLKNTKPVAERMVEEWSEDVVDDYELQNAAFVNAFDQVAASGREDMRGYRHPSQGGNIIPLSHPETQLLTSSIYAATACQDFGRKYPFLGWFLKADEGVPTELIVNDVNTWFRRHPGGIYPLEQGFVLGVHQIQSQLQEQTGRIVRITRGWLVLLFLLVQLIPFGAIGYMAYQDLTHNQQIAKDYSDDFDIDNI